VRKDVRETKGREEKRRIPKIQRGKPQKKKTLGTETSKYQKEKKTREIDVVVASEASVVSISKRNQKQRRYSRPVWEEKTEKKSRT
jgi:hypothetical protein